MSLALLVSAGLLVRSLSAASAFDVGFETDSLVLAARGDERASATTPARTRDYYRRTPDRLRACRASRTSRSRPTVPLSDSRASHAA